MKVLCSASVHNRDPLKKKYDWIVNNIRVMFLDGRWNIPTAFLQYKICSMLIFYISIVFSKFWTFLEIQKEFKYTVRGKNIIKLSRWWGRKNTLTWCLRLFSFVYIWKKSKNRQFLSWTRWQWKRSHTLCLLTINILGSEKSFFACLTNLQKRFRLTEAPVSVAVRLHIGATEQV